MVVMVSPLLPSTTTSIQRLEAALRRRNAREVAPFSSLVHEYSHLLKSSLSTSRSFAACTRRAEELRLENVDLKQMVKDAEVGASRAAEAADKMEDYRRVQVELAQAYKEKAAQSEKLLAARALDQRSRWEQP